MGRNLHPSILRFFTERMQEHSEVLSLTNIPAEEDWLFRIERNRGRPPVIVHMSDAYFYGDMEYMARPSCLGGGDFILIARPEAHYSEDLVGTARKDKIGLGKIGKLMGALRHEKLWLYKDREEKEAEERRQSSRPW